jgi:aryl-alcohol dehydrogenase-like predicted oxidoreductase
MQWGWTADEDAARLVMDRFVELGGNLIDTADVYSRWAPNNPGGVSEEMIGRWMKERRNRQQMVIATKVRGQMQEGPNGGGLGRKHIMEAVEASLRRLQTDYIDLYQAHAYDDEAPIEETMRAFSDLVSQGKVLFLGASNYPAGRLGKALGVSEARGWPRYDALQPHYNLVHRGEFERELRQLCEDNCLGVLPYSPLAAGFLTGKYRRNEAPPPSQRAGDVWNRYAESETAWRALETLEKIAQARGATPSQIALAWLLSQPVITSPIVGANDASQLDESLGGVEIALTADEVDELVTASGGPLHWND